MTIDLCLVDEERNYTVYIHINKINSKTYVGITCQKPEYRWNNGNGYRSNPYFINAIDKYDWNSFDHIIMFENKTKEEAEKLEILFIKVLISNDRDYGYNIDNGGNSIGKMSKESKLKMSKAQKGKKLSKETKLKISKAHKGKRTGVNNHNYGKTGSKSPSAVRVVCGNVLYGSIRDFAECCNVDYNKAINWLNGINITPQKFIDLGLKYADKETKLKTDNNTGTIGINILCDNIIYKSIEECARYYNINSSTMNNWLSGKVNMPRKFFNLGLRYLDGEFEYEYQKTERKDRYIICDNQNFKSIKECSDYYEINANTMQNWLNNKNKMPKTFIDKGLKYSDGSTYPQLQTKKHFKRVICDNIVFDSMSKCAEFYGTKQGVMSKWLLGKRKMPEKFVDLGLRYYDKEENNIKKENDSIIKENKRYKKVVCDDIIFETVSKCAEYYDIKRTTLTMWLKGKNGMPQKYIDLRLRYYDEEIDGSINQYRKIN